MQPETQFVFRGCRVEMVRLLPQLRTDDDECEIKYQQRYPCDGVSGVLDREAEFDLVNEYQDRQNLACDRKDPEYDGSYAVRKRVPRTS